MCKIEKLENGMAVVTEYIPHVKSVSIGFWVKNGPRYESAKYHGVSHFLEHMIFKGTSSRTAQKIAEELDSIGGVLNAFTSREYSCLYAKVLSEFFDQAFDVLTDMIQNSVFDDLEIEKEKQVVIEEIKMCEDIPDEAIHDFFVEKVWDDHPLGKSILGADETINNLYRDDLLFFYKHFFNSSNIVLSVSGNITHEKIVEKANKIFNGYNVSKKLKNGIQDPPEFKNASVYKSRELEQTHFCLGAKGVSNQDSNLYSLIVLNNILGGAASSRLFQKIREDLGLAYSVFSYHTAYEDGGLFIVYAGSSSQNAPVVAKEILNEIEKIRIEGVTEEELNRTKTQLKGSMFLNMESTSNRMLRLGKSQLSYDRIITLEEIVDKIYEVEPENIQELAANFFSKDKIAFTAFGPENYRFDLDNVL